jgi:hypothetical protein
LRVICPEHTKDQKVSDTEVCGFPLTKDIFKVRFVLIKNSSNKVVLNTGLYMYFYFCITLLLFLRGRGLREST